MDSSVTEATLPPGPSLGDRSPSPAPLPRHPWSPQQRFGFRFAFLYLLLFCLPSDGRVSILGVIPGTDPVIEYLVRPPHALYSFVAVHIFRLHGAVTLYHPTGSGDTTLDYVEVFCWLVFSLTGACIWTALDRRRQQYTALSAWLRVLVRYTVGLTLLSYGIYKVFPLQFSTPSLATLNERYGDSSPMHLLWTFMGASAGYRIFGGFAEVVPGVLLFFRRTTPLGALLGSVVMADVVALNFFYDVPVKIYSAHLLLLCGFLLLPEIGVLANVLVLRRASLPVIEPRVPLPRLWQRRLALGLKIVFLALCCYQVYDAGKSVSSMVSTPKPNELRGLWKVDSFVVAGQELAAVSPSHRWSRIVIGRQGTWSVELTYDGTRSFKPSYAGNTASLTDSDDKAASKPEAVFTWQQAGPQNIVLTGTFMGQPATIRLHGSTEDTSLLMHRGFHWINEDPYQR